MLETPFSATFGSPERTGRESVEIASSSVPIVRVLIADPDAGFRSGISQFLEKHGFIVFHASCGFTTREILESQAVDVLILDVLIPGDDGLAIARELSFRADLSVIIVSELAGEMDRIIGLEAGADDYLAKPASPRELLARIRAVRRRLMRSEPSDVATGSCYTFCGWTFDIMIRSLRDPQGKGVSLSDGEFALLRALVQRPQRVLTRDQLLEYASGPDTEAYDRAVDTQVSRLRRKLRTHSSDELIRTVRNEGYMFLPKVALR